MYQDAVFLCMKDSKDEDKWKKAIYWVFDAPDMKIKPFEERIEHLKQLKSNGSLPSFVNIVDTVKCKGISVYSV